MKTPIRLLLASAAILITTAFSHCFAATSKVVIPFTGAIQSGSNISFTSGAGEIKAASAYYYSISGTCHGVGSLKKLVPAGSDLVDTLSTLDATLAPYMEGAVVNMNMNGGLPFTCVGKLATGTINVSGNTITCQAQIQAGISMVGVCNVKFSNIVIKLNGIEDTTDGIVIDKGLCVVQVLPLSGLAGSAHAGMSFIDSQLHANGLLGHAYGHFEGVSLASGSTASFNMAIQNVGASAGTLKLSAHAAGQGFTQKFIYQGVDETAAVTGTGGFKLPPTGTLAGGAVATMTWQLTNKTAVSGTKITNALSAIPFVTGTSTYKDSLQLTGTAQ